MVKDNQYIMVILSSPSGVGKQQSQRKFNKNIVPLKFQFPTLLDHLDQMK